ncbi:MAG: ComF family protein [Candidatus Eisenbacteria bacterium]
MVWKAAVDFLYPPFCLVCGRDLPEGGGLVCEPCWERARRENRASFFIGDGGVFRDPGGNRMYGRSANRWNEPLGEILHRFKYGAYPSLGERLALQLAATVLADPKLRGADLLVPAPLTRARRRERGYNQSAILARRLSELTGIPSGGEGVRRRGRSRSQTKLDAEERRRNVRGVFRVTRPDLFAGRRVVIVDDVITTGATAWELALVLAKAGAAEVSVLAVAKAAGRSSSRSSSTPGSSDGRGGRGPSAAKTFRWMTGLWRGHGGSTPSPP